MPVSAVRSLSAHARNLLDFLGRAVGEVAGVGVLGGRHCSGLYVRRSLMFVEK